MYIGLPNLGLNSPTPVSQGVGFLLQGYSSGLALDAQANQLYIRESDVVTYSGVPYGKFTPDVSSKNVFSSAGVLGLSDHLFITQSKTGTIALPDGQGGDVGKGFTCTGLCWDGSSFWVGNDGGNVGGDATRLPSVVQVSMSGQKLSEIDIGTLYGDPNNGSVQGVAFDTSDNTLWVAQVTASQVRHMTRAGVDIGDGFAMAGVNGLAYDSLRNRLWCSVADVLTRRTKAGVVEATYTLGESAAGWDHLFYDAQRDYIWFTRGLNGSQGECFAFKAADGTQVGINYFTNVTAIEGVCMVNGQFYVCHDGYYHAADGAVIQNNEIQIYPAVGAASAASWSIDHNPATLALRGYLFEQAYTRASDFPIDIGNGAQWTPVNGTVPASTTAAPDGTMTASMLTANAGTFAVHVAKTWGTTTGAALNVVVAKAGTHRYLWLGDRGDAAIHSATFDLQTGTVVGSSNATGRIEAWPGGRYRVWMEFTRTNAAAAGLNAALGKSVHTLDWPSNTWAGTETIEVWDGEGANTAFALSPLTSPSPASHIADTPALATSEFDWSATENSFVIEATTPRGTGTQTLLQAGTAADGLVLYRNSSNEIHMLATVASVTQADLNLGTVANSTSFKVAFRAKASDYAGSLNGGAVVTDVSGTLPTVTTIRAGHSAAGEQWNGWIKTITIVPVAMSDATLITRTT